VKEDISTMKKFLSLAGIAMMAASTLPAHAADKAKLDGRIREARTILREIMATPDKGIPLNITEKARCVAVIPGFKKGAFLIGAQYGQGVVTCNTDHGWSAPAFIQITGASFGLQAGGQSTDLILVAVTREGGEHLLHDKLKLGGDIAVAAGPVGRNSSASAAINAGFLSYSRSKGIFAGVDLTGDVVNQNGGDTEEYYGKDIPYEKVLNGGIPVPVQARPFVRTVTHYFHVSNQQ
jgi:lipid-binding SYLF domain-containing protein